MVSVTVAVLNQYQGISTNLTWMEVMESPSLQKVSSVIGKMYQRHGAQSRAFPLDQGLRLVWSEVWVP